ncbi:MAG: LPXTG cell wall anchor domain-containing protein [Actinomycetia bacterium]|nr:LPXTG cell wall anchor domain-containing protein [Actinomycetes bacterium]
MNTEDIQTPEAEEVTEVVETGGSAGRKVLILGLIIAGVAAVIIIKKRQSSHDEDE